MKLSQLRRIRLFLFEFDALLLLFSIGLIVFGCFEIWMTLRQYENKFFPGTYIDGVEVSGRTRESILKDLQQKDRSLQTHTLTLDLEGIQVASTAAELGKHLVYEETLNKAFSIGRNEAPIPKIWRVVSPAPPKVELTTQVQYDKTKLTQFFDEFEKKAGVKGEAPHATLRFSGSPNSLTIFPGKLGRELKRSELQQKIAEQSAVPQASISAVMASTSTQLSTEQVAAATERAKKYVNKQLIFRADNKVEHLTDQQLVTYVAFPTGFNEEKISTTLSEWEKAINRPAQNAEFEYDKNTLNVTKFAPHRNGLSLNSEETKKQLTSLLEKLENSEEKTLEEKFIVVETEPEKTLGETNDLGIKERLGFGESQYHHSIPGRIHNVAHTAKIINWTIVKPGEEFSFNKALGEVSARTGFKPAYVISGGRTVLGDGGGVCQVSTTTFRALLNAGIPITKRKAHSYRVSYYELNSKPGVDATVFSGEVDLRFINDTGHHLIINTETDSQDLYMFVEIWGTSDGRTAEIVDHKTWDARPAPPPLYQDDPSLPRGRVVQVDWAASGIKASFKNIVKDKDGKIIREDEYVSNYVPWRAIYLRGTQ